MKNQIDRRAFIVQASAVPVILGFPFVIKGKSQEEISKEIPKILKEGLDRMKEEYKYGLIVVIPEGEKEQADLTKMLDTILKSSDEKIHELLSAGVWICLPEKEVQKHLEGSKKDEKLIAIDMQGKKLEGSKNIPEDMGFLITKLQLLLYGKKNIALQKWSEEAKGKFTKEDLGKIDESFSSLKEEESKKSSEYLSGKMPKIVSLVVLSKLLSDVKDVRQRFTQIIEKYYASNPIEKNGSRLPYGLKWETEIDKDPPHDPCPGCGKAVIRQIERRFLRLVTN